MELEWIGLTKERAKELVNINWQMGILRKKPRKPFENFRRNTIGQIILAIVLFAITLPFGFSHLLADLLLSAVILSLTVVIRMKLMEKELLSASRERKTLLEEDGVSQIVNGVSDIKFNWNAFSIIRVFGHNIVCIPKEAGTLSVSFPIEHLGKIRQYIEEHNVDLEIL